MKTRPTDSPTEGVDSSGRPDEVLQRVIDRTERAIEGVREDYDELMREIQRDVEKLRDATTSLPAESGRRSVPSQDCGEERLEAMIASLPGRVAELVAAELAGPNVQAALRQIVDARLRAVTEAIARIEGATQPKPESPRGRRSGP